MQGCLSFIVLVIVLGFLVSVFSPKDAQSNQPQIPEAPPISQQQYEKANKWLLSYYKDYYNAPNWYVKNTQIKNGKIVVNLKVVDRDSAYDIPMNKSKEDYFISSVCPSNLEEIYKIIRPEQIEVEIYDYSGISNPPDLIGSGSCYSSVTDNN